MTRRHVVEITATSKLHRYPCGTDGEIVMLWIVKCRVAREHGTSKFPARDQAYVVVADSSCDAEQRVQSILDVTNAARVSTFSTNAVQTEIVRLR